MKEHTLNVRMLGEFTVSMGNVNICGSNRSRKIWLLLSYLAYHRNRAVSQDELLRVLWGEGETNETRSGALKTTIWRARQMLEALGESVSKNLIVRTDGGYRWNPKIETDIDVEMFENLCQRADSCKDEGERLELFMSALELYQGEFLGKLSSEPWAVQISAHYQNIYTHILHEVLPLMLERQHFRQIEQLCRTAIKSSPYDEILYQHLMRSLMGQGEYEKAAQEYHCLRNQMFSDLGVLPDNSTQELYNEISGNLVGYAMEPDEICRQLQEECPGNGALICDYSMFRQFYQAEQRSIARRGDAIHVGILSITDNEGKELPRRSLIRAMENLGVQIRLGLRKSDIAARCSDSQFVMLLLQANYENGCMVCERTVRAFYRAYPHSPAKIQYTVVPLLPASLRKQP